MSTNPVSGTSHQSYVSVSTSDKLCRSSWLSQGLTSFLESHPEIAARWAESGETERIYAAPSPSFATSEASSICERGHSWDLVDNQATKCPECLSLGKPYAA